MILKMLRLRLQTKTVGKLVGIESDDWATRVAAAKAHLGIRLTATSKDYFGTYIDQGKNYHIHELLQ